MTTVDARSNPEAASAAAAAVLADDNDREVPAAPPIAETTVNLPGGYLDLIAGTTAKTAEVRELNGADEEAIFRAQGNLGKTLDTILTCGLVSVGDKKANRDLLDDLLAGDRDAIIVGIRRATFGDVMQLERVTCPSCREIQDVEISCTNDIPMKTLTQPGDRWFTMTLTSGKDIEVSLPDGATQRAFADSEDTNIGVLNTIMLSNCVKKINGTSVITPEQVRKGLSWRDRDEIIKEINEREPGPRLQEVKRPCSSCGEDIALPMNLVDLFRF